MRTKKIIEKQEKQLKEITARIIPIAKSGRCSEMTIREICEEAGISTGMFYRHFRSKNDVLSIAYIQSLKQFLENSDSEIEGMTFPEQLIYLKTQASLLSAFLGPDGIMIYINNENERCDCTVPRNMIDDKITECYEKNPVPLPEGKTLREILDDITVLAKGITFEWYTLRDKYDYCSETRRMIREMVSSFFPETAD